MSLTELRSELQIRHLASPLILLWLTSSKDVMGENVNGPGTTAFAGIGLIMLIAMAGKTAFVDLPDKVDKYLHPAPAAATADESGGASEGENATTPSDEDAG